MRRHFAWVAVAVLSIPAAAAKHPGHGKAGLWSSTTTMTIAGMSNVPPQTHSATFCMTPAQVASDMPQGGNPDCKMTNMHTEGRTITADMVCHGKLEATGHFVTTYDSDTHYLAKFSFAMNGMTMSSAVEGTWLKADCAGAAH